MTPSSAWPLLILAAMLGAAEVGRAQHAGVEAPAVEPGAVDALERMGAYLHSLNTFEVRGEAAIDQVIDSGQKLQFECAFHLRIRRPDRLWIELVSHRRTRQVFYDGKSLTLWDRTIGSPPASPPSSLPDLVEQAAENCGAALPLADLFRWDIDPFRQESIHAALYVGSTSIQGDPCDQYAFREIGIDWQIWIQSGDSPLPRKLVVTATDDEAKPQYTTTIEWNLAPVLRDEMFAFEPPAESHRIIQELMPP